MAKDPNLEPVSEKRPLYMKDLTARQRLFIQEFRIDHNAKAAAIRAGYSPETAANIGNHLKNHPVVGPEIEKTIKQQEEEILADIKANEEIVEDANATTGKVIRELARIAFADPRRFVKWKDGKLEMKDADEIDEEDAAAIAEITQTRTGVRIKFHSKRAALLQLTKLVEPLRYEDKRDYSQLTDGQLDTLDELETLAQARTIWRPDPDAHRLQRKRFRPTAPYQPPFPRPSNPPSPNG